MLNNGTEPITNDGTHGKPQPSTVLAHQLNGWRLMIVDTGGVLIDG